MELKFIRNKSTLEITRSTEQPLLFGQQHPHLDNGVIKPDYEYLDQDEINNIIFSEEKENKKIQVRLFRDRELLKTHPQTVSSLTVTPLESVEFKIRKEDKAEFVSNITTMQDGQIRGWNDANGTRQNLTKDNFQSLLAHLNLRDDQCYEQEILKRAAIDAINPSDTKTLAEAIDEIRNFDVTQVIV